MLDQETLTRTTPDTGRFPGVRPRRLRHTETLRRMVRETRLSADDFIYPLFVTHGTGVRHPISSMPGIAQLSVDQAVREAEAAATRGIPAVLLFGLPASKDPMGLENFAADGIVQQTTRAVKAAVPELVVITDVCLCEYTDHGHCGVLNTRDAAGPLPHPTLLEGYVLNDDTLEILGRVAVSHAEAGADIVAPSGMMDSPPEGTDCESISNRLVGTHHPPRNASASATRCSAIANAAVLQGTPRSSASSRTILYASVILVLRPPFTWSSVQGSCWRFCVHSK